MRPVVSAEEMQQCDKTSIRSFGIPSLLLMENAGAGTARWIRKHYGPLQGKSIGIVCGKGNNGGDGLVAARHLANAGAKVTVFLFKGKRATGDAAKNAHILEQIRKTIPSRLAVKAPTRAAFTSFRPDIIVDAVFGTGFSGSVKKEYARVIDWMNSWNVPRIAIDIPSGVNATTGEVQNVALQATATVTLGALKRGLLCNEGRDHGGTISVLDIGIPAGVFERLKPPTAITEADDVRTLLPRRASTVHKYTAGKVFVLAGSRGYTGAAALASTAALRSGAGAVVLGTPDSVHAVLSRKLTEVIVEPLPSTREGSLAASGVEAIMGRIQWADTVLIGPGLSRHEETAALVLKIISIAQGNILLDADALNIMGKHASRLLKQKHATIILTPHTGEFCRMTGDDSKAVELMRIDYARKLARQVDTVVVLKGAPTAIARGDGRVVLNPTGNPGMATVGSGDVLSGIITGFWAQGMEAYDACTAGVYIHGFSGDLASLRVGQRSVVANDLIDFLPQAMKRVEGGI